MKVTVEYSAQLRKVIGRATEELHPGRGATVQEVVADIAKREGEPLQGLLLAKEGRPSSSILLCVNDEQVFWSTPRELEDGDTITITTPIAGGSAAPGCPVQEDPARDAPAREAPVSARSGRAAAKGRGR